MSWEHTFSRPDEPLPEDSLPALRAWLDVQRFAIVAAYHVVALYPEIADSPASRQEELLFELHEPPEVAAPSALFMAVGMEMPELFPHVGVVKPAAERRGVTFSFVPERLLAPVRDAGELVWILDPARPRPKASDVAFVYHRPELPDEVVAAVRPVCESAAQVERAYFLDERLVRDGIEIWSRLTLHVEADFGVDDAEDSRRLSADLLSTLGEYLDSFGISTNAYPKGRRGLVVFEREGPR